MNLEQKIEVYKAVSENIRMLMPHEQHSILKRLAEALGMQSFWLGNHTFQLWTMRGDCALKCVYARNAVRS